MHEIKMDPYPSARQLAIETANKYAYRTNMEFQISMTEETTHYNEWLTKSSHEGEYEPIPRWMIFKETPMFSVSLELKFNEWVPCVVLHGMKYYDFKIYSLGELTFEEVVDRMWMMAGYRVRKMIARVEETLTDLKTCLEKIPSLENV